MRRHDSVFVLEKDGGMDNLEVMAEIIRLEIQV